MTLSPQGWAYEIVSGGDRVDGFVLYDVRFWTSPERQRDGLGEHVIDGVRCDLANNFKMQIREQHQRIKRLPATPQEPEGFMLHASGVPVPVRVLGDEQGLGDFLKANGNPARSGYTPFIFPTYAGVDEELSNEWQHELHTVPLLEQAEANIERYITVAKREGWEGDKRGTTVNLQVGASGDDAEETISTTVVIINSEQLPIGDAFSERHIGIRFSGVSGISGTTIDAASLIFRATFDDSGDFIGDWFGEALAAPEAFVAVNGDITGRTQTTATTEGDGSDFGSWTGGNDETFTGPLGGIAGVIQELADTFDPSAIVLLHKYSSGTGERVPLSYDNSTSLAPKLDITFTAALSITAALTGTALPTATEAEIAAGGETVIITLTDDTWLAAGGAFDGSRQAIIDGFTAAASPALGWNDEVRDKAPLSAVVRTNATTVTITWTNDASAYDIAAAETITATIPAAALTTSGIAVVATPTFEITVVTPPPPAGGAELPAGWGGPASPPRGTGPPGGAASGAPTGTAPIYGGIGVAVRARQLADAVCDGGTVVARGQQSVAFSLVQLLHCLQGRGVPHAPQDVDRSLELIFVELGIARPRNVTLAQELDIIAAHLP